MWRPIATTSRPPYGYWAAQLLAGAKTVAGEGADRLETLYMRGDIERNERITGAGGIGLQPLKE